MEPPVQSIQAIQYNRLVHTPTTYQEKLINWELKYQIFKNKHRIPSLIPLSITEYIFSHHGDTFVKKGSRIDEKYRIKPNQKPFHSSLNVVHALAIIFLGEGESLKMKEQLHGHSISKLQEILPISKEPFPYSIKWAFDGQIIDRKNHYSQFSFLSPSEKRQRQQQFLEDVSKDFLKVLEPLKKTLNTENDEAYKKGFFQLLSKLTYDFNVPVIASLKEEITANEPLLNEGISFVYFIAILKPYKRVKKNRSFKEKTFMIEQFFLNLVPQYRVYQPDEQPKKLFLKIYESAWNKETIDIFLDQLKLLNQGTDSLRHLKDSDIFSLKGTSFRYVCYPIDPSNCLDNIAAFMSKTRLLNLQLFKPPSCIIETLCKRLKKPSSPFELIQSLVKNHLFYVLKASTKIFKKGPDALSELLTDCTNTASMLSLLFFGLEKAKKVLNRASFTVLANELEIFPSFNHVISHLLDGNLITKLNRVPSFDDFDLQKKHETMNLFTTEAKQKFGTFLEQTLPDEMRLQPVNDPSQQAKKTKSLLKSMDYNFNAISLNSLKKDLNENKLLASPTSSYIYNLMGRYPISNDDLVAHHNFIIEQYYDDTENKPLYRIYQSWVDQATLDADMHGGIFHNDKDNALDESEFQAFIEKLTSYYTTSPVEKRSTSKDCFGYEALGGEPDRIFLRDKVILGLSFVYTVEKIDPRDCLFHAADLISQSSTLMNQF